MTKKVKHNMRVLIFPGGYVPGTKYGGILTSKQNFVEVFGNDLEIYVVAANHDYKEKEPYQNIVSGWNNVGKAKVLYVSDEEVNASRLEEILSDIRPDMLYLSGTITSYFRLNRFLILLANQKQIPTLVSSDGDICTNALKIKIYKKAVAIVLVRVLRAYKNVFFQSTSNEETINLKKYLGIKGKMIFEVTNVPGVRRECKHQVKQKGTLRTVFVSRICRKKNLIGAIKSVSQSKADITLDIYGPIEDEDYWDECKRLIADTCSFEKIKYIGQLDPRMSKEIYSKYDCLLFPTMSENYGYVIEESLLCGCPVITTRGVTPWDDIDGMAGYVENLGDTEGICHRLEELAEKDNKQYGELREAVAEYVDERLGIDKIKKDYYRMFERTMGKKICTEPI